MKSKEGITAYCFSKLQVKLTHTFQSHNTCFYYRVCSFTSSRSMNTQHKNLANIQPSCPRAWSITHIYYMASSVSRQEEPNPTLRLAIMEGKIALSCPLGTTHSIPKEEFSQQLYNKSINLMPKRFGSRWLDIGLILFLDVYGSSLCLGA